MSLRYSSQRHEFPAPLRSALLIEGAPLLAVWARRILVSALDHAPGADTSGLWIDLPGGRNAGGLLSKPSRQIQEKAKGWGFPEARNLPHGFAEEPVNRYALLPESQSEMIHRVLPGRFRQQRVEQSLQSIRICWKFRKEISHPGFRRPELTSSWSAFEKPCRRAVLSERQNRCNRAHSSFTTLQRCASAHRQRFLSLLLQVFWF